VLDCLVTLQNKFDNRTPCPQIIKPRGRPAILAQAVAIDDVLRHVTIRFITPRLASRMHVHSFYSIRLERCGSIDVDGQSASGARDRSQQGAQGRRDLAR
jgi:hypothetical protein